MFVVILALHALINIFLAPMVALFNGISVWWHVVGALIIIGILIIVPDRHQSADFVFTERSTTPGFADGAIGGAPTGSCPARRLPADDVHDHRLRRLGARGRGDAGAEQAAAKGIWQSVRSRR